MDFSKSLDALNRVIGQYAQGVVQRAHDPANYPTAKQLVAGSLVMGDIAPVNAGGFTGARFAQSTTPGGPVATSPSGYNAPTQPALGRPVHQKVLEDLFAQGKFGDAQNVIQQIPIGDPYRETMQHLLNTMLGLR